MRALGADLNVYAYVSGGALKNIDPLGLECAEGSGGQCGQNSGRARGASGNPPENPADVKKQQEFQEGYRTERANVEYENYIYAVAPRLVQARMDQGRTETEARVEAAEWAEKAVYSWRQAHPIGSSDEAQQGAQHAQAQRSAVKFLFGVSDKAQTVGAMAGIARGANPKLPVPAPIRTKRLPKSVAKGTGYASFDDFKVARGPAGKDRDWHHIVEQAQEGRFGAGAIHNTKNLVKIDKDLHSQISAHYSSKTRASGSLTVREWLAKKSFDEQHAYGVEVLRMFKVKPP